MMKHQTSRRDFLKKSAFAAAGLSIGATSACNNTKETESESNVQELLFGEEHIKFFGEHANGHWEGDALHIRFEDHAWPIFTFEFPKVNMMNVEGVELDIENIGEHEATIFGYADEMDPYCWSSGLLPLKPGEREKLRIMVFHQKSSEINDAFPKMMGVPGHSAHMGGRLTDIDSLRIELEGEGHPVNLALHGIQKFGLCNPPIGEAAKDVYPIMDRFGQYRHGEWINKIHRVSDFQKHNEKEKRDIAANPSPPGRNKYGGWIGGPKFEATGHFYTKQVDGRWWFIDPEGRLYWAFGPTYVRPSLRAAIEGYEYLYEDAALKVEDGDFFKANLIRKYGEDNWKEIYFNRVHERLRHWGMNTFGIACDRELCLSGRTPYSIGGIGALRSAARNGLGELDSAWKQRMEESAARTCENTADDPYCIGYFVDNEIHDKPDFERWNYYFATCRDIVKKYAPNKLYLGPRLDWHRFPRGGNPVRTDQSDGPDAHDYSSMFSGFEAVLRAYGAHADVLSFNQYRYTYYNLRMPEYANKPIIIGETTVGAMDRGMIHPSLRPVQSQEERAFACKHMLESALDNPWIAGLHWFMYMDQPCTGWASNSENFQMGLIDICDTPYPELNQSIMDIGYSMYTHRLNGKKK